MKRMILMCCLLATFILAYPQKKSEVSNADTASWTKKKAAEWYKKLDWLNGLKIKPSGSVNQKEFAHQYHLHKQRWDKAFAYLKSTDLSSLEPGKFPIDSDEVYAIVTVSGSKDFNQTKWEAHHNYADIHYMISGEEKIGIASVNGATIVTSYDPAKDIAFYNATGKFYLANQGVFFIFFPQLDAHRPGIKVPESGKEKKIVIKVRTDN